MQRTFLLDIVITQGPSILQLFPGKNQPLLIRWNPFLVLDLRLDIVNGIGRFDIQRDGFSREGFDKNLHGGGWFG